MSKKEQIVLNRNGGPDNRNSVTFPRMVDFIKNEGTDEEAAWFVELCEQNQDDKNNDYGVNIVEVRNAFIKRFWPTAYSPKAKVIQKAKRDYEALKASVDMKKKEPEQTRADK